MSLSSTTAALQSVTPFEDVYRQFYPRILMYFRERLGERTAAEDLTSDVFMYCFRHFDSYDAEKASLATWIYLVARSRFINFCRDRRTTEDIEDHLELADDSAELMEKALYIEELRRRLHAALLQLEERQKQAVVMRYFEEKSTGEIAQNLCVTPSHVRVLLCRALKRLRNMIEK